MRVFSYPCLVVSSPCYHGLHGRIQEGAEGIRSQVSIGFLKNSGMDPSRSNWVQFLLEAGGPSSMAICEIR